MAGDDVLLACGNYQETGIRLAPGVLLHGPSGACAVLEGVVGQITLLCEDADGAAVQDLRLVGGDSRMRITQSQGIELVRCELVGGGADPAAGRALDCESATVSLTDCSFSGNATWGDPRGEGAALRATDCVLALQGCLFEGNTTTGRHGARGGAVYLTASTADVTGCTFVDNLAGDPGSGSGRGGGLSAWSSRLTMVGSSFTRNVVRGAGGTGAGADVTEGNATSLSGCAFVRNVGRNGGGLALNTTGGAQVSACVFRENEGEQGAALWAASSIAEARECLFLYNEARFDSNPLLGSPISVVFAGYSSPVTSLELRDCTIHGSRGTAVYAYSSGQAILTNTVVTGGDAAAAECFFGEITATCTDIWGNAGDWTGCIAGQAGTAGNFSADPMYCNLGADDFRVADVSPCAPANSGGCGRIGAGTVGCGVVAVEPQSWGRLKSAYRGEGAR